MLFAACTLVNYGASAAIGDYAKWGGMIAATAVVAIGTVGAAKLMWLPSMMTKP